MSTRADTAEGPTILFRDEHLIAAVKPIGLPTHAVTRGGRGFVEQLSEQLGLKLGVHQRLDAATSGVLIFSCSPEGARGLAARFEGRSVRKCYLAITVGAPSTGNSGRLQHRLAKRGKIQRVVRSGGQPAVTNYRIISQAGPFCQCEIEIETGRTHQIRAQLAAVGAPILGDRLYGGGHGPGRLMLHAHSLELTHPVSGEPLVLKAEPPALLAPAGFRSTRLFGAIVDHARKLNQPPEQSDSWRVLVGSEAGMPGVRIDRYAEIAILRVYERPETAAFRANGTEVERLGRVLAKVLEVKAAYRLVHREHRSGKGRPAGRDVAEKLFGPETPERWPIREHGLLYIADRSQLGCGLYLDQAENRRWLADRSQGRRMLNLFAYTCSFSVVAAANGAQQTTSVDLSAKALEWARENFEANRLPVEDQRFYRDDALQVLARLARRGEKFGLIVCDPPSFARRGKKSFSVTRDWSALVQACVAIAAPGASLLLCINHRATTLDSFRKQTESAIGKSGRQIRSIEQSSDEGLTGTRLKTLRVELD